MGSQLCRLLRLTCISALADTPDFLVRSARLKQDYGAVHVIRCDSISLYFYSIVVYFYPILLFLSSFTLMLLECALFLL